MHGTQSMHQAYRRSGQQAIIYCWEQRIEQGGWEGLGPLEATLSTYFLNRVCAYNWYRILHVPITSFIKELGCMLLASLLILQHGL